MQKHANLVDLVKSFPTNIFLQNLASIQKRTSPIKFDHLAEKSEKGSVSNLSTKTRSAGAPSVAKFGCEIDRRRPFMANRLGSREAVTSRGAAGVSAGELGDARGEG